MDDESGSLGIEGFVYLLVVTLASGAGLLFAAVFFFQ